LNRRTSDCTKSRRKRWRRWRRATKRAPSNCSNEIRGVSKEIVGWLDRLYARVTTAELKQAA
jgi:hypothetical protein